MGRRRNKADHQADTRGGGFAGLPKVVMESPAYRDLSLFARAVLMELLLRFNGYNNGEIVVSVREIAERLSNSNYGKISRAIIELIDHGLIWINVEATLRERTAREYGLTFITSGKVKFEPARNTYLRWKKKDADDVSAGRAQSADGVSTDPPFAADDVSARFAALSRKTVNRSKSAADDASALIGEPYPLPSREEGYGSHKSRRETVIAESDWWDDDTRPPDDDEAWPELLHDRDLMDELEQAVGHELKTHCFNSPRLQEIARAASLHPTWLWDMVCGEPAFQVHFDRVRQVLHDDSE